MSSLDRWLCLHVLAAVHEIHTWYGIYLVSDHVLSQMKLPHHLILTHLVINIRVMMVALSGGGVPLSVKELQH